MRGWPSPLLICFPPRQAGWVSADRRLRAITLLLMGNQASPPPMAVHHKAREALISHFEPALAASLSSTAKLISSVLNR